jgi:hypothetical protein
MGILNTPIIEAIMTKAFLSAMALTAFFSAAALADEVEVSKNSVSKEETSSTAVSADPSVKTTTVTRDPASRTTSVTTESPEAMQVKTHKQKVSAETTDSTMDK